MKHNFTAQCTLLKYQFLLLLFTNEMFMRKATDTPPSHSSTHAMQQFERRQHHTSEPHICTCSARYAPRGEYSLLPTRTGGGGGSVRRGGGGRSTRGGGGVGGAGGGLGSTDS